MDNTVPKTLIFVSSHRRHGKVADRLIGALAAHRKVELFSFDRGDVDHPVYSDPNISHTSLGRIRDGMAASRLLSLMRAAWILSRAGRRFRDSGTVLIANTLELLLLSWLCGLTRLPTIYDMTDIRSLQLSKSVLGRSARWLERQALKRVKLLVVTSPWFYWEYYLRWLRVPNSALLVENRVGFSSVGWELQRTLTHNIAWNGLIRCRTSAMVLLECLKASPASLHLSLHGSLARLQKIGPELLERPNCSFTGQYDPESLSSLLSSSSFLWAVDFADGENSMWLLPNRLYEGIAAGIPLIAVDGSATAEVVRRYNIGLVLPECSPQALIRALESCTAETYKLWLANMSNLRRDAQRGNEWTLIFGDVSRWASLKRLPTEIDVGVVLCADAL